MHASDNRWPTTCQVEVDWLTDMLNIRFMFTCCILTVEVPVGVQVFVPVSVVSGDPNLLSVGNGDL